MDYILEVKNLTKFYGDVLAVDNISFSVKRGNFFAFLGPNGAGKSTTIKIISTLLQKDAGQITLNNKSDEEYIRNKIGIVFQENMLDDELTVKENLMFRGAFYFKNKKDLNDRYVEVINYLELKEIENRYYKNLSGGQKRKTEIARALFSNPEVLLLDEPTTGLDPKTRKLIWTVLEDLQKNKKMTIFLTTHYMEEAANADWVVIINLGKIYAQGSPTTLKGEYSKDKLKIVPQSKEQLTRFLNEKKIAYTKIADQFIIETLLPKDALNILEEVKDNIAQFEMIKGSMDDVFLNVIGSELDV